MCAPMCKIEQLRLPRQTSFSLDPRAQTGGREISTMPVLPGFLETLCEKLPTTLPCSNNIMCVTTTWFLEISAESWVNLRHPVQIPELGISTIATLFFCCAETSSGCFPLLVSDCLLELSALEQVFHKRGLTSSFPKKKIYSLDLCKNPYGRLPATLERAWK